MSIRSDFRELISAGYGLGKSIVGFFFSYWDRIPLTAQFIIWLIIDRGVLPLFQDELQAAIRWLFTAGSATVTNVVQLPIQAHLSIAILVLILAQTAIFSNRLASIESAIREPSVTPDGGRSSPESEQHDRRYLNSIVGILIGAVIGSAFGGKEVLSLAILGFILGHELDDRTD